MNQPVLGVRGTAEYVKATGEGTAESPYIPVVQIEGAGQALAADSIPVVLPASQIEALTPPTTMQISGTLPGFADIPTVRLESQTQPMSVNATGELQESINAMRTALNVLKNSIGHANPDTSGNIRVLASIPAAQTLGAVTTLTNQSQIGGFNAADHIPALLTMTAQGLRNNIIVS